MENYTHEVRIMSMKDHDIRMLLHRSTDDKAKAMVKRLVELIPEWSAFSILNIKSGITFRHRRQVKK